MNFNLLTLHNIKYTHIRHQTHNKIYKYQNINYKRERPSLKKYNFDRKKSNDIIAKSA